MFERLRNSAKYDRFAQAIYSSDDYHDYLRNKYRVSNDIISDMKDTYYKMKDNSFIKRVIPDYTDDNRNKIIILSVISLILIATLTFYFCYPNLFNDAIFSSLTYIKNKCIGAKDWIINLFSKKRDDGGNIPPNNSNDGPAIMHSLPTSPIWMEDQLPANEWENRSGESTPRALRTPPLDEEDIGGGFA